MDKKKAMKDLEDKIKSGEIKFKLASQDHVNFYEDIKAKFLEKVIPSYVFISDDVKLSELREWMPGVRLLTLEHFNVDIEPVMHKTLVEIFEYIDSKPAPSITVDELADSLGLERAKKD